MNGARVIVSVALAGFIAIGCESIAGIEDRVYDVNQTDGGNDSGSDAAAPSQECLDYCTKVMANCKGTNAVYSTQATCLGVCALLPAGDPLEPAGNTVACRAKQAEQAGDLVAGEPTVQCPAAGPGGNGVCGDNCDSYCDLMQGACSTLAVPNCKQVCAAALKDTKKFDVVADHGGDTLQCRLVHVSSATVDPNGHCPHAQFRSTQWCVAAPPSCDDYCRVNLVACTGTLKQYDGKEQCMAACALFSPGGTGADESGDTIGCRMYHSYSAIADPTTHCQHTGPSGGGVCVTAN